MPGRDKTGPTGRGPMSGRGYGNCTGLNVRDTVTAHPRWGFATNGRGRGLSNSPYGGYGRRRCHFGTRRPFRMRAMQRNWPDDTPMDDGPIDKASLLQQKQALQSEIETINKQLNALEAETANQ